MILFEIGIFFGICLILFFQIKIQKEKNNNQINEDILKILFEKLSENNFKNLEENTKKFIEIEKSIILNMKNNLLEGMSQLNKELGLNSEKLTFKFGEFSQFIGNGIGENNIKILENINKFKDEFRKSLGEDFEGLNKRIESRLDMMNVKVEERLARGFQETTKTFNNVLERLSKIDEAQKKIDALSTNVISLQDILTDKKSRGIFGEVQLNQILNSIFGEKNEKIFKIQYKMSNGNIADAILFTPNPMGKICIDSKFPLENYRKMYDNELEQIQRENAKKDFVNDMKRHIDAISSKYIIDGETGNQAVLFLPSEAIFAEINAHHSNILDYANKKNVRITSPTTLMSILTIIQVTLRNIERNKYADIIHRELIRLQEEFARYQTRWNTLQKDIDKISKDVKEITTTSDKISKRFLEISNVELTEENGEISFIK